MKKIVSTLVSAAMLACMVPTTAAFAATSGGTCKFTLSADKTSAHPGNTITFTIKVEPSGNLSGLSATIPMPTGYEFVSAELTGGKAITWNIPLAAPGMEDEYNDDGDPTGNKVFSPTFSGGTSDGKEIYKDGAFELGKFTYKATADAAKENVTLTGLEAYATLNYDTSKYEVSCNSITVSLPELTHVPAKEPTCGAEGNYEYWICSDGCGKVYKADKTTETSVKAETRPKTGAHDFTAEVVDAKYLKTKANCKDPAVYFKSCTVCHEKGTETFTSGAKDPNNHNPASIKVDPTTVKAATCTEKGYTGDGKCLDCGAPGAKGQDIDALGHTGGEATCVKLAVCDRCGEEHGELNADNHKNTEVINAKAATEDAEGYTGDTYCNDCEKVVAAGQSIPKLSSVYPGGMGYEGAASFPAGSGSGNSGDGGNASGNTGNSGNASGNTGNDGNASGNTGNGGNASGNTGNDGNASGNGGNGSGNGGTVTNNPSPNPATGITLAVVPVLLAAGAAVVIAKNKRK